jgi:hypothetical protein
MKLTSEGVGFKHIPGFQKLIFVKPFHACGPFFCFSGNPAIAGTQPQRRSESSSQSLSMKLCDSVGFAGIGSFLTASAYGSSASCGFVALVSG